MAQSTARKHEAHETTENVGLPADSTMVIKAEDGEGHGYFVPIDMTDFLAAIAGLPAQWQAVAISGAKYELTRGSQSEAKRLRRAKVVDVLGGLIEWAKTALAKLDPDVERFDTFGTMRVEEARLLTAEKIKAKQNGKEASEADISATLQRAYERYMPEINARLMAKLAAGYTPTARKAGGAAQATGGVVDI